MFYPSSSAVAVHAACVGVVVGGFCLAFILGGRPIRVFTLDGLATPAMGDSWQ